jgi:hypothetical protein
MLDYLKMTIKLFTNYYQMNKRLLDYIQMFTRLFTTDYQIIYNDYQVNYKQLPDYIVTNC